MKKIFSILFLSICCFSLWSQSPKREMRGPWLATVYNLDWPKNKITATGNTSEINSQKNSMIRMLDSLVMANMNTVCFQVRSRADAMYQSSYEPWAADLVATRGQNPGYDPLAFVIEEGHKRGLEVHAWVNPYRYESTAHQWDGLPGDFRASNPNWILTVKDAAIFDPGLPEVRNYITGVIEEIVTNYNLDGVLFDDYFYLQGINQEDATTYQNNNPNGMPLGDWRRENVNMLIKQVYNMIQQHKPYLTFGVSPAGIWDVTAKIAASYGLALPAGVSGGYAYSSIYCDPIAWLQQESVDYISPQIYWEIDPTSTHDYARLSPWWSNAALQFGKQFYSSHSISNLVPSLLSSAGEEDEPSGLSSIEQAIYKQIHTPELRTFGPSEVGAQVEVNRLADKSDAPGSILYSMTKLYSTPGFIQYLKNNTFTGKALPPAIHWKTAVNPGVVSTISLTGNVLNWNPVAGDFRYTVYAIPQDRVNDPAVFNSSQFLLGMTYSPTLKLPANVPASSVYAVAVLDRYGNEYAPVFMNGTSIVAPTPVLTSPANGASLLVPFNFTWEPISSAISYILEIAKDINFAEKICAREVYSNSFDTHNLMQLNNNTTYYWRVRAKTVGNISNVSETRIFTPVTFRVLAPADMEEGVSLTPQISWVDMGASAAYEVEVATSESFSISTIVYTGTHNTTSCTIPEKKLASLHTYYVRVKTNRDGEEIITPSIGFTTIALIPDIPEIILPVNNSDVKGQKLLVTWKEDPRAMGFRVEVSETISFPGRQSARKELSAYTYETMFEELSSAAYYVRVRANYGEKSASGAILPKQTEWSPIVRVNFTNNTGLESLNGNQIAAYVRGEKNKQLVLNLAMETTVSISLYTISGVKLDDICKAIKMSTGEQIVDIRSGLLPQGVYLLMIEQDRVRQVLKFVNK